MDKEMFIDMSVKGVDPIQETEEVVKQRYLKNERKFFIGKHLGVSFSSVYEGYNKKIFKNVEEENQYFHDCLLLSILLDKEEPLPIDLVHRLLLIKERKDKLKGKN